MKFYINNNKHQNEIKIGLMIRSDTPIVLKYKRNKKITISLVIKLLAMFLLLMSFVVFIVMFFVERNQTVEISSLFDQTIQLKKTLSYYTEQISLLTKTLSDYHENIAQLTLKENVERKKLEQKESELLQLEKENKDLQTLDKHYFISRNSNVFNSIIELRRVFDFIKANFNMTGFEYPKIEKLYDSKIDSQEQVTFIDKIKNKTNILTVMKIENDHIIGSFLHLPIKSNSVSLHVQDENSFLFSITQNEMYPIKKESVAYWHHPQIFFSFGNLDLIIGNHFTDNYSSFTNFPDSYKNVGKDYKYKITGGLYHFRIKALEAYEIILNNK